MRPGRARPPRARGWGGLTRTNQVLLMVAGAGATLGILLALFLSRGRDATSEQAGRGGSVKIRAKAVPPPTPPAPRVDALAALRAASVQRPLPSRAEWRALIDRARPTFGDPAVAFKEACRRYLATVGAEDQEIHELLDDRRYQHTFPEEIICRDYPFVRAVEAACAKRWFSPAEIDAYEGAERAWVETKEHLDRLRDEPEYRAIDQVRANVASDPNLRDYAYATRWVSPYLICYASRERLSEYDLLAIPSLEERQRQRDRFEIARRAFEPVLDEKARIFDQVHKEFVRRYEVDLGLKPLMAPFGGRPDYPAGSRAFRDGCPLVVWIFSDQKAFLDHHKRVGETSIDASIAGYFSPSSGWVFLYDDVSDRMFEIDKNVHEGVHQLVYWYGRQRTGWSMPPPGQDFFDEGFADWIGSVRMGPDRKLTFRGVSPHNLRGIQAVRKIVQEAGRPYPIFPLKKLVEFGSYLEVARWGVAEWKIPAQIVLALFYQQAWAFLYFLDSHMGGEHHTAMRRYLALATSGETGWHAGSKPFRTAFEITEDAHWARLQKQFDTFFETHVLALKPEAYDYEPPPRNKSSYYDPGGVGAAPARVPTSALPSAVVQFLDGWAAPVGNDTDGTTGYPRRVKRIVDGAVMVLIPAGTFRMGAVPGDADAESSEKPRQSVKLTSAYYLDETEVTVGMWRAWVAKGKGASVSGSGQPGPEVPDTWPMHSVSWKEAKDYVRWAGVTLPTEAQWERAAKGGHDTFVYPWGLVDDPTKRNGSYTLGRDGYDKIAPVLSFPPNSYGLYDMSGNVREWCTDGQREYSSREVTDPVGSFSPDTPRVVRGGGWRAYGPGVELRASCRSVASAGSFDVGIGFRCARSLP